MICPWVASRAVPASKPALEAFDGAGERQDATDVLRLFLPCEEVLLKMSSGQASERRGDNLKCLGTST